VRLEHHQPNGTPATSPPLGKRQQEAADQAGGQEAVLSGSGEEHYRGQDSDQDARQEFAGNAPQNEQ
jgi:hypothetical protein